MTTPAPKTLDEQITEIAKRCISSLDWSGGSSPLNDAKTKSACYAAIRAFAEREPSEELINKMSQAFHVNATYLSFADGKTMRKACVAVRCAMLTQALKEAEHAETSR